VKFLIRFVLFALLCTPVIASRRIGHAIIHDWKSKKFKAVVRRDHRDLLDVFSGGETYLHLAAAQNRATQLKILLNTPLKDLIQATNNLGETAIETAIMYGSIDTFEVLQEHYQLNDLLAEDETYLHLAARENKADQLEILLDRSPKLKESIRSTNREGLTAIEVAMMNGHFDAFSVLLKHGDANYRSSSSGWTLAHLAARLNKPDMLWALYVAGAVMNAKESKSQLRPIEAAESVDAQAAINALMEMVPKTASTPNSRSGSRSRVSISQPISPITKSFKDTD